MEIIQLPGYTEFEKVSIAERYLIPKQKGQRHRGRPPGFPEEAVRDIIHCYTKEAGVRNLEREIATVCRKIARDVVAKGARAHADVGPTAVADHPKRLRATSARIASATAGRGRGRDRAGDGPRRHHVRRRLLATEVSIVAGKGKLVLTGKLGDVMQESAQAAISYVRSRAPVAGARSRLLQPRRHPRALAGGRHPQGRPVGRHHDVHRAGLGAAARPGPARPRHDRRDHAARAGAAHRWPKEKILAAHRRGSPP